MVEGAKQLQLLDVHCEIRLRDLRTFQSDRWLTRTKLASELRDSYFPVLKLANVNVLEATTANLLKLGELFRRNFTVFQTEAFQVQFKLLVFLFLLFLGNGSTRLVSVSMLGPKEDWNGCVS